MAQVSVNGQKRFAVRIRAKSDLMNARNLTLDELQQAIKSANANTPLGILDGPSQTLTITGNAQLMKASDYANLIIAQRNGEPVRLKDVADVQDSFQSTKAAGSYNGDPRSSTVDSLETAVIDGKLVRVLSWYDNEWGFSNRMIDTAGVMAKFL